MRESLYSQKRNTEQNASNTAKLNSTKAETEKKEEQKVKPSIMAQQVEDINQINQVLVQDDGSPAPKIRLGMINNSMDEEESYLSDP